MSARRLLPWIAATFVFAAIVHAVSLYAIPRIVMSRVLAQMGAPNAMHQGQRPDARSRGIVRPSTDLLYSICPYDLSAGRSLALSTEVPQGTYWSAAVYDFDSDNYFVRDDRQVRGRLSLRILPPGSGGRGIISPSTRGIVIIRTLVDSDSDLARLERIRLTARCGLQ